jgi:predicted Fe-Mo cluster-binding NifX family protein
MTSEKIAVPSNSPGGLDSFMSDHFGHCDLFTIVTIQENEVLAISTVNNVAHGPGGCLAPIGLLAEKGVNSIVVSGMGKRPLAGFQEAGINVFWTVRSPKPTIKELVEDLCNSKRQPMELTQACKGHADCHGQ